MQGGRTIYVGTRASKLALWQSRYIQSGLQNLYPEMRFEIVTIKTTGDKILDVPLAKIGDKGLFTKQIETALLSGKIDLAVHSLKDLPTVFEVGLDIGAVLEREDPKDALVSKTNTPFSELPAGSIIGTSSLRRRAQLLAARPDIRLEDIRGNVDTRLRKLDESKTLSAIILAGAGLRRMGLQNRITQLLPGQIMLPAVGQGALAIEIRQDDHEIIDLIQPMDHEPTRWATTAERSFLKELEGGCQVPIGALGTVKNGSLALEGLVCSLDGKQYFRQKAEGSVDNPERLGQKLAAALVEKGADKVLEQINIAARGRE